ncbi:TorF family putative porin [Horticoccus sp. 23ND18S-11]|uniref:TorF family putative porin n=1 Tax=Horticoccus sp. 23ND18S-11 TaxID=3391832 RepID=UPI0039C96A57
MKTKLLLWFASALTLGAKTGWAQTAALALPVSTPISVSATASVVSQYMFRGLRIGDGGFQPAVELSAGDGLLGVWAHVPFNGDKVPDSSDPEIDLYGAYTFAVGSGFTLTPGFTSYHYPKAPTDAGFYRATFEPSLAVSGTIAGVKMTPKLYYDVVLKGLTTELTALYALPLKDLGSELDFTATYGAYTWKDSANHATPEVKTWGEYWLLSVAAPFQISREARITLGVAYTEGRRAFTKAGTLGKVPNSLAVGRGVVTLSYTRTF